MEFKVEKIAKEIAEIALDEIIYRGKSIKQWAKEISEIDKHDAEIRADERAKTIKDLYASDNSSTLNELLDMARADERKKIADKCKYLLGSGDGKKKSLECLIKFLEKEQTNG